MAFGFRYRVVWAVHKVQLHEVFHFSEKKILCGIDVEVGSKGCGKPRLSTRQKALLSSPRHQHQPTTARARPPQLKRVGCCGRRGCGARAHPSVPAVTGCAAQRRACCASLGLQKRARGVASEPPLVEACEAAAQEKVSHCRTHERGGEAADVSACKWRVGEGAWLLISMEQRENTHARGKWGWERGR